MIKDTDTNKIPKIPGRGGAFGRPAHMMMGAPVEKAKDFKGTIKKLFEYLKPFWLQIVLVLVFAVSSTVFAIVSPKILGTATNQIVHDFMSPTHIFHFDVIRNIILLLIGLYVLSSVLSYIQGWILSTVTQKVTYGFRKDISLKINRLPLSYFDKHTYGEVLSRITNDVDTVSTSLNQSLSQIITSVVMILGITVMMLSISALLTLVAVVILPFSFILIAQLMKRSQKQFVRQQEELGNINGHVEEMYAGHVVMRVFNGEAQSVA